MNFLKKNFIIKNNIITNQIVDNTTKDVVNFYNIKPFPNYDVNENKATLLIKGDKNFLAKKFKKFAGFNKKILEVGCGTGQLSIYFSIGTNNEIVALDPTLESLKLAANMSKKSGIKNVKFLNADILDDILTEDYFDLIWTNGVLHHTKDPRKAFKICVSSLKKNGYILVGLYNSIGRIRTKIRKYIYKLFGKKMIIYLDPVLRNLKSDSPDQIEAWIRDQYEHPVESTHTMDEILEWFDDNKIEFLSSIPKCNLDLENLNDLFSKHKTGNIFYRILNQIFMIFNYLGDDGGLFIMIGKKKND